MFGNLFRLLEMCARAYMPHKHVLPDSPRVGHINIQHLRTRIATRTQPPQSRTCFLFVLRVLQAGAATWGEAEAAPAHSRFSACACLRKHTAAIGTKSLRRNSLVVPVVSQRVAVGFCLQAGHVGFQHGDLRAPRARMRASPTNPTSWRIFVRASSSRVFVSRTSSASSLARMASIMASSDTSSSSAAATSVGV